MKDFGQSRVLEPKNFFPVSAWRLDNSRGIGPSEIRIKVTKINLEEGNFRQLCSSCDFEFEKIKERVFNIVNERGKLHNPLTDSGGICTGIVEAIGKDFKTDIDLQVGDKIIGIASLTSIPLKLDKILSINYNYRQLEVEGYAIFFKVSPLIKMPSDIQEEVVLSAFDESGSIYKAAEISKTGNKFLVLGSDILKVMIYAAAMKFSSGRNCKISVCIGLDSDSRLSKKEVFDLLSPYVDSLQLLNMATPIDNYQFIAKEELGEHWTEEDLFDTTVICSNMKGIEGIGVLLTKNHGNLFFTNLINNYNLVLLLAESFGKNINTLSLEEYNSKFPIFTTLILRQIKIDIARLHNIYRKNNIVNIFPENHKYDFEMKNIKKVEDYAYKSANTQKMLENVLNVAKYDCNVLIWGETGVGKEKILDILHKNSSRKGNRCIKINCSAISETLAESEFFGYERGAFTGAKDSGKKGFFELANNGIIFLDEVGDMSLGLQAKLLRVLQERKFYRVGGEEPIDINVRVICATNKNLRRMVEEGKFREDLFYRLNICEIYIPPLRERREDIIPLVDTFINRYNNSYMLKKKFSLEAYDLLERYDWPGNVRELENIIHKLIINSKDEIIDGSIVESVLNFEKGVKSEAKVEDDEEVDFENESLCLLDELISKHEKIIINDALVKAGTTRGAAKLLGISQSQLMRKKKKYNL